MVLVRGTHSKRVNRLSVWTRRVFGFTANAQDPTSCEPSPINRVVAAIMEKPSKTERARMRGEMEEQLRRFEVLDGFVASGECLITVGITARRYHRHGQEVRAATFRCLTPIPHVGTIRDITLHPDLGRHRIGHEIGGSVHLDTVARSLCCGREPERGRRRLRSG